MDEHAGGVPGEGEVDALGLLPAGDHHGGAPGDHGGVLKVTAHLGEGDGSGKRGRESAGWRTSDRERASEGF